MNTLFNNNFLVGMLLARDLPRQEQFITGLVAGQMPANSPIGPFLLQPLVSRLATEEQGRASAESNNTALQQPLEIELPDTATTATLSVPGVTASFSRLGGSPDTTVDSTTGVVTLPNANEEETISIAVDGTARQVTLLRGPRKTNVQAVGRTLTEADLAALGRAFLTALQGVTLGTSTNTANVAEVADRPPGTRPSRPGQRGGGGAFSQSEAAADSPV